jgi:pimeloyl-ACP methyl ester carboxylesterase
MVGYQAAMRLLADRYQVCAVDLRGQGPPTWIPRRYCLDVFSGDLVHFIDRVIGRPVIVNGLSSGGSIAAGCRHSPPHQRVRASRIEAQVRTTGRVLEPHGVILPNHTEEQRGAI